MRLLICVIFGVFIAANKVNGTLPPPGKLHHPLRYDLMKELPLSTTQASLGSRVARPALEQILESIRERPQHRTLSRVYGEPRRRTARPFSSSGVTKTERVVRAERTFDKIMNFVDLLGRMDSYISDRAKLAVRKLSAMYSEEERYKRGQ